MAPTFELEDAMSVERPNADRLIATLITISIRDGADHLFIEKEPDVLGVTVSYRVRGNQYELVPPPLKLLSSMGQVLRSLVSDCSESDGRSIGWFVVGLAGHEMTIWAMMSRDGGPDRLALNLPIRLDLSQSAVDLLNSYSNSDGNIEFEDPDFE